MNEESPSIEPVVLVEGPDLAAPELAVLTLVALFILALAFLVGPFVGLLAVGVAGLAGLTAHGLTRDHLVTAASIAFAPLYVTGLEVGFLALLASAAIAGVVLARIPLVIAFAVLGLAWPSGAGVPLAAVALAAVIGGSAYQRDVPSWAGKAVALPVFIVGGIVHQAWLVLLGGVLVGLLVDYAVRHPALPRLAQTVDRSAPWLAALPAILLFMLATLGKSPSVEPLRLLSVGWGAVGAGGMLALAVLGAGWFVRASDRVAPVWLAFFPAALVVLPLSAFVGDLAITARGAAVVFTLFVIPFALGTRRLAAGVADRRSLVVSAIAFGAAIAAGLRFWLD